MLSRDNQESRPQSKERGSEHHGNHTHDVQMAGHYPWNGGDRMNEDILRGQWNQLKGSLRKQWGKLTDDDLDVIQGDTEVLVGKLVERYGRSRESLEREIEDWLKKEGEASVKTSH